MIGQLKLCDPKISNSGSRVSSARRDTSARASIIPDKLPVQSAIIAKGSNNFNLLWNIHQNMFKPLTVHMSE